MRLANQVRQLMLVPLLAAQPFLLPRYLPWLCFAPSALAFLRHKQKPSDRFGRSKTSSHHYSSVQDDTAFSSNDQDVSADGLSAVRHP